MKQLSFYIFLISIILLVGLNSCTIKKRLYQPGYHVEWHKINKETKSHHKNEALVSNDMENKEEIVFEHHEKIIEEPSFVSSTKLINQTEIVQEFEPFYASNNENANNIEIINTTKQKNTSTYNTQKVDIKINESGITEKTISSSEPNNESKKLHSKAIIGFVLSIIAWATILSFFIFFILFNFTAVIFMFFMPGISIISGIAGVHFSDIALDDISNYPEKYRGKILAKAGLVIGLVLLSIYLLYIIFILGWLVLYLY